MKVTNEELAELTLKIKCTVCHSTFPAPGGAQTHLNFKNCPGKKMTYPQNGRKKKAERT